MQVIGKDGRPVTVHLKGWPLAGLRGPYRPTPHRAIELFGGGVMAFEQLYRTQHWVAVCVNKLSRGMSMLPLKTYQRTEQGRVSLRGEANRDDTATHPLASLVAAPFPKGHTRHLVEAAIANLAIHGNALEVKYRPRIGAPPSELWPIPWKHITVIPGQDRDIDGYRYDGPLGKRVFLPEDVIHHKWWADHSPLEPLADTLASEVAGRKYQRGTFEDAARPSGVVEYPGRLKDDQRRKFREEVNELYAGVDSKFRVMLLDSDMKFKQMSYSAQEAEAVGFRRLNAEEVAAAYDIPQPAIGMLERATFSNITEQHIMLYQDTFGPWLDMLEADWAAQLIESETAWQGQGLYVEFEMSAALRGNPKERSESWQREFQSGKATPNDGRQLDNRSKIDDPLADCIFVPANMVPLGPGADAWNERIRGAKAADGLRDIALAAQQLANAVDGGIVSRKEARALLIASGLHPEEGTNGE